MQQQQQQQQLQPYRPPGGQFWYSRPPTHGRAVRANYIGRNEWSTSMLASPCTNPATWCLSCLFPYCCVYKQREQLLLNDLQNYMCCAGMWGPSWTDCMDGCTRGNEPLCLCLESFFCLGCAVSANRWMVMSHYNLQNDYCDTFIMSLACFCAIAACLTGIQELENASELVFFAAVACMIAQQEHEMNVKGYPMGFKNGMMM